MNNSERVLFVLCIFGLLYAAFLFFVPKQQAFYSVLYLEPDYYGKNRLGNIFANFGMENHEASDYNYAVYFFLDSLNDNNSFDSVLLAQKNFFLAMDSKAINFVSFPVPKELADTNNLRFRIQTMPLETNYSVHFWLKNKAD